MESFTNRSDCLAKATTYSLYFTPARPTPHKQNLTPWQIVQQLAPQSPLDLCLLPPLFLDYFLTPDGGYDLSRSYLALLTSLAQKQGTQI